MSGGGQQTSTSGPPEWVQGAAQSLLGAGANAAMLPYNSYQGPRVAPFTGLQNQAFEGIQGRMGGTQGTRNAEGMLDQTVQGYGFNNPYLDAEIDRSSRGITDRFNQATNGLASRFSGGGAFGGSAHLQAQEAQNRALATGLGDVESQIRGGNYGNERNRQLQAANQLQGMNTSAMDWMRQGLGAGNQQQAYGQNLIDSEVGEFNRTQSYPREQLSWLADILGRAQGGAGTTVTQPGTDRLSQGLGGAALLASQYGKSGK